MTREEFDVLVERIEARYGDRLWVLRLRIVLLLALGYGVFLGAICLVFTVSLLFLLGALAVDSIPGLLLLAFGILLLTLGLVEVSQLLWVGMEMPETRELRRDEAPQLFALLDRLRAASKSARVHRVIVTEEFNASVVQIPRFGVFGWPTNILTLGLPLMSTLSPPEFAAVLAHEMAHLSAGDNWFSGWLYRLRRSWERMFLKLHDPPKSRTTWFLRRGIIWFIDWYWPRFNAHAFVLSRTNEYAADRAAANWVGCDQIASALWRVECHRRRLTDEIWPRIWKLANTQPAPPSNITTQLIDSLAAPPEAESAARWVSQSLQALTNNLDTHPSLADRLRALDCSIAERQGRWFPDNVVPTSAESLFGSELPTVCRDVDAVWQRQIERVWRGRHGQVISLKRQLSTLGEAAVDEQRNHAETLWEKAKTVYAMEGPEAAAPLLRQVLTVRPDHSPARLALGQYLLEQGDLEGEQYLLGIVEKEEDDLIPQACGALASHFQESGQSDRLREIIQRVSRFEKSAAAANQERSSVSAADHFLPHDLSGAELAPLCELLRGESDLAEAHLARKELKHFPWQKLFVLCVSTKKRSWGRSTAERDADLVRRLISSVQLPGRVVIISPQGTYRPLAKKLRNLDHSSLGLQATDAPA